MKHPSDETIIAYIYGEAPPADAAELERHCRQCFECSQKIEGIKKTLSDIDSMADDGPPEYLCGKLNDFLAKVAEIEGRPAENITQDNISSAGKTDFNNTGFKAGRKNIRHEAKNPEPAEDAGVKNFRNDSGGRDTGFEEKYECEIMTPSELAAYLKIPLDSIYSMLGELPHVALAGTVRFRRSSIEKWLDLRERNRPAAAAAARDIENPFKLWRNVI